MSLIKRGRKAKNEDGFPSVNVDELIEDWGQVKICITIAVGKASGWTNIELAEKLGVSDRMVYNYADRFSTVLAELEKMVAPLIKMNRREIKQVALDKAYEELEKLVGDSMGAIQAAIQDNNLDLASRNAWAVIHQLKGKPTNTVNMNTTGTVNHQHYVMPATTALAFEEDAEADQELFRVANKLRPSQPQLPAANPDLLIPTSRQSQLPVLDAEVSDSESPDAISEGK